MSKTALRTRHVLGDDGRRLDLAPRLERPLSLWNPLDYVRLLYWTFYFPQAIRWYSNAYGWHELGVAEGWQPLLLFRRVLASFKKEALRKLYLQQLGLVVAVPLAFTSLFYVLGAPVNWWFAMFGIGTGISYWILVGLTLDSPPIGASGTAVGIAIGCYAALPNLSFQFLDGQLPLLLPDAFVLGAWFGGVVGITLSLSLGRLVRFLLWDASVVQNELTVYSLIWPVLGPLVVAIALVAVSSQLDFLGVVAYVLTFGAAIALIVLRLPEYLAGKIGLSTGWSGRGIWSRTTPLPIAALRGILERSLAEDPERGIEDVDSVVEFTTQFIPAIRTARGWLASRSDSSLLPSAEWLTSTTQFCGLAFFCSASLPAALLSGLARVLYLAPLQQNTRVKPRTLLAIRHLRYDTPVQAACAGFWSLSVLELDNAVSAFQKTRGLPGGEVLLNAVTALRDAFQATTTNAIAEWAKSTEWVETASHESGTGAVCRAVLDLHTIAREAEVIRDSISRLNRSAAIGRAVSDLTHLVQDSKSHSGRSVGPAVEKIAEQWREILSRTAGEGVHLTATAPVQNPFVVGDPVSGRLFAGRTDIMRRLEELWGSEPSVQAPSVVLYGHRRMGKSSILQNLGTRFGRNTLVATFNMQRIGRVRETAELLHALALWLHDAKLDAGLSASREPEEDTFLANPYLAFNRFLTETRRAVGQRRVILAIDEFEEIEEGIREGRIEPDLLEFLRSVLQEERWLVLAFAGLHTLEEMTGDYWNPLFGSVTPIRVGFLSWAETADLLANPTDDFPLDFTRETVSRVYELVRGQPYLTQLIGRTLVTRYNREVFESGRQRDPRFTVEDVDAVVKSDDFYETGDAYFSGVWGQSDNKVPGQHALLIELARREEPARRQELWSSAGLSSEVGHEALETLVRHDVVAVDSEGRVEFTVPLMRGWLRRCKMVPDA